DILTDQINQELAHTKKNVIVNLASNEYFKAVNAQRLNAEIITPVFKDWKNGQYKIISFFAKKARGMMSSYIIRHRLKNSEAMKEFTVGGYVYDERMSSE